MHACEEAAVLFTFHRVQYWHGSKQSELSYQNKHFYISPLWTCTFDVLYNLEKDIFPLKMYSALNAKYHAKMRLPCDFSMHRVKSCLQNSLNV